MRLSVKVLPLSSPHGPKSSLPAYNLKRVTAARNEPLMFAVPVAGDQTFRDVWAEVERRYKKNYCATVQEQNNFVIKKLQDAYGCDIDLDDTVGSIFGEETDKEKVMIQVIQASLDRELSIPVGSNLRPVNAKRRRISDSPQQTAKRTRLGLLDQIQEEDLHPDRPLRSRERDITGPTELNGSRHRRSTSPSSLVFVAETQHNDGSISGDHAVDLKSESPSSPEDATTLREIPESPRPNRGSPLLGSDNPLDAGQPVFRKPTLPASKMRPERQEKAAHMNKALEINGGEGDEESSSESGMSDIEQLDSSATPDTADAEQESDYDMDMDPSTLKEMSAAVSRSEERALPLTTGAKSGVPGQSHLRRSTRFKQVTQPNQADDVEEIETDTEEQGQKVMRQTGTKKNTNSPSSGNTPAHRQQVMQSTPPSAQKEVVHDHGRQEESGNEEEELNEEARIANYENTLAQVQVNAGAQPPTIVRQQSPMTAAKAKKMLERRRHSRGQIDRGQNDRDQPKVDELGHGLPSPAISTPLNLKQQESGRGYDTRLPQRGAPASANDSNKPPKTPKPSSQSKAKSEARRAEIERSDKKKESAIKRQIRANDSRKNEAATKEYFDKKEKAEQAKTDKLYTDVRERLKSEKKTETRVERLARFKRELSQPSSSQANGSSPIVDLTESSLPHPSPGMGRKNAEARKTTVDLPAKEEHAAGSLESFLRRSVSFTAEVDHDLPKHIPSSPLAATPTGILKRPSRDAKGRLISSRPKSTPSRARNSIPTTTSNTPSSAAKVPEDSLKQPSLPSPLMKCDPKQQTPTNTARPHPDQLNSSERKEQPTMPVTTARDRTGPVPSSSGHVIELSSEEEDSSELESEDETALVEQRPAPSNQTHGSGHVSQVDGGRSTSSPRQVAEGGSSKDGPTGSVTEIAPAPSSSVPPVSDGASAEHTTPASNKSKTSASEGFSRANFEGQEGHALPETARSTPDNNLGTDEEDDLDGLADPEKTPKPLIHSTQDSNHSSSSDNSAKSGSESELASDSGPEDAELEDGKNVSHEDKTGVDQGSANGLMNAKESPGPSRQSSDDLGAKAAGSENDSDASSSGESLDDPDSVPLPQKTRSPASSESEADSDVEMEDRSPPSSPPVLRKASSRVQELQTSSQKSVVKYSSSPGLPTAPSERISRTPIPLPSNVAPPSTAPTRASSGRRSDVFKFPTLSQMVETQKEETAKESQSRAASRARNLKAPEIQKKKKQSLVLTDDEDSDSSESSESSDGESSDSDGSESGGKEQKHQSPWSIGHLAKSMLSMLPGLPSSSPKKHDPHV